MNVSKRLQMVSDSVKSGGVAADIGCDHGFTSIYLIENGLAEHVIAMDINKEPLERAREHILQYGMQDKISLRLSDGVKELLPDEVNTILISGMGGALICRILKDGRKVVCKAGELVLSPQSEIHLVRKLLHQMGFVIAEENMVLDAGKYYVVIRAVQGEESYTSELDYLYGRKLIESGSHVFYEFMEKEKRRVEKILSGMEKKTLSESGLKKKQDLLQEHARIQEVLNRICTK